MEKKIPSSNVVLVTGCSSGFGLLIAARLSSHGFRVVATMRDLGKASPLMTEVKRRGGEIDLLRLDVTDPESIRAAVAQIIEKHGRIDVLINNAGYGLGGAFEDLTPEEIRGQMEVNFFGVQNVTRAVLPVMRKNNAGKIINISSVAGFSASPFLGAYNASKWALEGFSESLRYEAGLFGIDVVLIQPGTYKTKIFYENARYARRFHDPASPYFSVSQQLMARVKNYVDHCHKDPEKVAALAEKLVRMKHPPFRNIPDIEARALFVLRKLLPFSWYSRLIQTGLLSGSKPHESS